MTAQSVNPPFPIFNDVDGNPLEDGFIYIGTENLNPETNLISVYWDAALTIPAAQPIRTLGGYPSRAGTPARIFADSNYSITVRNKNGTFIYSSASVTDIFSADLMNFIQSGTGVVPRTAQSKMRDAVCIFDFMNTAEIIDVQSNAGSLDVTAAFTAAFNAHLKIHAPTGTYLVNNLRYVKSGNIIFGDGTESTLFKQSSAANPAIYCLSDATTGQLNGVGFIDCGVIGSGIAGTVASVVIEATTPYVVKQSVFDFHATNVNRALEIVCTAANEVYLNEISVKSNFSADTAFITKGVYNTYYFSAAYCANGNMLNDSTINGTFLQCIGDGAQIYGGQNCTILNPTVETIYGTAVYSALQFTGFNHTVISPTLTEIAPAKCTGGAGFVIYNSHTIIHPRVWGTVYPTFPFDLGTSGFNSTIIGGNVSCTAKLEQYLSSSFLNQLTLIGNTTSFSIKKPKYPSPPNSVSAATYTIDASRATLGLDSHIVNESVGGLTLTMPSGTEHIGRTIRVYNRVAQTVNSASSNIIPMTGGAGTAILSATVGKWADLIFDGTNWLITANN